MNGAKMKKMLFLPLALSLGLIGCGGGGSGAAPTVTPTAPVTPANPFTATGGLVQPRKDQASVLLPSGQVVVFGGIEYDLTVKNGTTLNTAEIYTPSLGTWAQVANPMTVARAYPAAVLLADGSVLIAGGESAGMAELFDPATGTFAATGGMAGPRSQGFSLVALDDGTALAAGADLSSTGPVVEVYNPTTKAFKTVGSTALMGGLGNLSDLAPIDCAANIGNGQVLLFAATGPQPVGSTPTGNITLVYNVAAKTFSHGPTPTIGRRYPAIVPFASGKAVVIGGTGPSGSAPYLASGEVIDTAAGTTTATGLMATDRMYFDATLLASGGVLVSGGISNASAGAPLASAEIWDPANLAFLTAGTMVSHRDYQAATLMANGQVIISGSDVDSTLALWGITPVASAEIYHP